jgi:hypothetical protein
MATKRRYKNKNKKTKSKRWVTAFEAAENKFKQTKSINQARKSLRKQALINARKLFGSV